MTIALPSLTPTEAVDLSLQLKQALRFHAGGVAVITTGTRDGERTGATVTSATALSVEPPVMIVNINRSSSSFPVIASTRHFVVNILSAEQQAIADRFAGKGGLKGDERYLGANWHSLESGALALEGAIASIDCAVEEIIERHSHGIILGRVLAISHQPGTPLVYHNGRYGHFAGHEAR